MKPCVLTYFDLESRFLSLRTAWNEDFAHVWVKSTALASGFNAKFAPARLWINFSELFLWNVEQRKTVFHISAHSVNFYFAIRSYISCNEPLKKIFDLDKKRFFYESLKTWKSYFLTVYPRRWSHDRRERSCSGTCDFEAWVISLVLPV